MATTDEMMALLRRLVENESPSHEKTAVDEVGSLVSEECRRLGGEIKIHPQKDAGDLIEAKFNSEAHAAGQKEILLLCHMDTVFPLGTLSGMPFHEKDGKVFGPGTSDMKGGIVVALTAIRTALEKKTLKYPVTVLFTSDEETGSLSSRALIEKLAAKSILVLVLEPGLPDGSIKVWRKGVGDFRITVRGLAAHAGADHEKGRNAIEEMAYQVIAIQKLTDYSKGTTLNVGMIHGGMAINAVPDEAVIDVDLRIMQPGESERIIKELNALQPVLEGTTITVSGELNRPPMPFDETMKNTLKKVEEIAARNRLKIKSGGTGGASDANFVAPLGMPVLDGLGPVGDGSHSEREFIIKDSLMERADLVEAILREW